MAAMVEDKKKRTQHTRSVFLMILCVCVCVCVFKTQLWCGFLLFLFFLGFALVLVLVLLSAPPQYGNAARNRKSAGSPKSAIFLLSFSFLFFWCPFFFCFSLSLAGLSEARPEEFYFPTLSFFSLSLSLFYKKKKRKIPSDIPNDPQLFFVSLFFLFSDVVVVDLVDDSSENDASLRLESKSWA